MRSAMAGAAGAIHCKRARDSAVLILGCGQCTPTAADPPPRGSSRMQCQQCAACAGVFWPRSQNRTQRYCGQRHCQQERRRRWKREKRRTDADYRDNQARAQRSWGERHPTYWREYRRRHPQYQERNRQQQRLRNARRGAGVADSVIAKGNASEAAAPVFSGTYVLTPLTGTPIAKGHAWTVTITALSTACADTG